MDRAELIARAKAILDDAYEEVTELVMLYVERTGEPLQSLCKEIDPDNWNALRNRVQKAQKARKATAAEKSAALATRAAQKQASHARTALKDPEQRPKVLAGLSSQERRALRNEMDDADLSDALDRTPPPTRTKADVDAASAERLPDPPPPDPWKEFRAGVRAGEEACDRFTRAFEYMHPEAWNLPPQLTEAIERDAATLAPRFREQAEFLEGLAASAGQHVNR